MTPTILRSATARFTTLPILWKARLCLALLVVAVAGCGSQAVQTERVDHTVEYYLTPVRIGMVTDWRILAPSIFHLCGTRGSGGVWCLGSNRVYGLGVDDTNAFAVEPRKVTDLSDSLTHSATNDCAFGASRLECWGEELFTKWPWFGDEPTPWVAHAWEKEPMSALAIGERIACMTNPQGVWSCWGSFLPNQESPEPVTEPAGWSSLTAGALHACALDPAQRAWCLGSRRSLMGSGSTEPVTRPVMFPGVTFRELAASGFYTCGIASDGRLYCWGNLSPSVGKDSAVPRLLSEKEDWRRISAGDGHSCALDSAGEVWCWGWNSYGELGDGTTEPREHPVKVAGGPWETVAASRSLRGGYNCATKSGGELWCWGALYRALVTSAP